MREQYGKTVATGVRPIYGPEGKLRGYQARAMYKGFVHTERCRTLPDARDSYARMKMELRQAFHRGELGRTKAEIEKDNQAEMWTNDTCLVDLLHEYPLGGPGTPAGAKVEDDLLVWKDEFLQKQYEANVRTEGQRVRLISETLGLSRPIRMITQADVQNALETIRTGKHQKRKGRKPQPLKSATINRYRSASSQFFGHAVDIGMIEENPARPKEGRRKRESEPIKYINRWLEESEKTKLLNAFTSKRKNGEAELVRAVYALALFTGLRRGELMSLRWENVSLMPEGDGSYLVVLASYAKAKKTRPVPLNSEAQIILKCLLPDSGEQNGLVFPGLTDGMLDYWRKESRSRCKWDVTDDPRLKDWRLHDCRHHFASQLVMRGVPIYAVKTVLGHSSVKVTERYAHLGPSCLWDDVEAAFNLEVVGRTLDAEVNVQPKPDAKAHE